MFYSSPKQSKTTMIAKNMIMDQNKVVINLNQTYEDVQKSIEPPVVKLTKLNIPSMTIRTKMNDYSEQISLEGQNSTAVGSSRKHSFQMDNSLCSQCSESFCVNSFCEGYNMNGRNVLSDAASNLSEAMSALDNSSQMDLDELSEVWELSSICTENSLQSKKKKIIKYLHIKSMSSEEQSPTNEDISPTSISHEDVFPIFEQIEKSSMISWKKQTQGGDFKCVGEQCLLSLQCGSQQYINRVVQSHACEEAKSGRIETSSSLSCGQCGQKDQNQDGIILINLSNQIAKVRKANKKIMKSMRYQGEEEQKKDNLVSGSNKGGPNPDLEMEGYSVINYQLSITKLKQQLSTIIEEEDSNDELQGGSLPVVDHFSEDFMPPRQKKQGLICLSFMLMNQRILESAKNRASHYLERVPITSKNYNAMLSMVTEVYRMLLLPEQALQLYISCLSRQQLKQEGQAILQRLCPQINKHQNIRQATQKVRKFFQL